jgi:A/G-specific adenine glycosylase
MWELPARPVGSTTRKPILRLRHSILNTDYDVQVFACKATERAGKWVHILRLPRLPLTGLARKILLRANLLTERIETNQNVIPSAKRAGSGKVLDQKSVVIV